tara:strand:- start:3290 stop:4567 length:1278 start_codon:yes stop_codon:yes gene_type:complete
MVINTISVVGLGYIGLPTATMLASKEKKVIGLDVNQNVIDTINAGKIHISEPGLEKLVKKAVDNGYLKATKSPEPADVFIISVPTPFLPLKKNGEFIPEPDLSFIQSASNEITKVLKKGNLVILESTSPVGTTEKMAEWMAKARPDLTFPHQVEHMPDVNVAYCPERVLPGHVVKELVENDRVIGGMSPACSDHAFELYKLFVKGECIITNTRTAEMVKLTENSCRDVQIAFANELSIICDQLNIDVWELIELANRHPRINILQPGPGVGGHCIAVDPWFIISRNPEIARLIHASRKVNNKKPEWVIKKVQEAIFEVLQLDPNKTVSDVTIACFGLAFKANIDDLRESPSMKIAEQIARIHKGKVLAVEPNIVKLDYVENIDLVTIDEAFATADIIIMLVDHKEFKEIRPDPGIKLIDTKGIWRL